MGVNTPKGEISDFMYYKNKEVYTNLYDGSIGFSKLLVEFGIFGILFCLFIIYKSFFYRHIILKYSIDNSLSIFYYSTLISILIYLFIRGGGYFGSLYFLLFLSFFQIDKSLIKYQ